MLLLLLLLLPGILLLVVAELWLTWRTSLDAANAAYDRSLLGAIFRTLRSVRPYFRSYRCAVRTVAGEWKKPGLPRPAMRRSSLQVRRRSGDRHRLAQSARLEEIKETLALRRARDRGGASPPLQKSLR